jgi:glycosyltransferase involved in cell wall biosynthesis
VDAWAHRPQGGFGAGEELDSRGPDALEVARAGAARAKSILVLDSFMPVFDRASGGLRMFTMLRALRQAGHAVTFYALAGGSRSYADAVGRLGIACFGGDRNEAVERGPAYQSMVWPALEDLLTGWHFDVVVVSPWSTAEIVLDQIRRHAPKASVIVDTNDVHFLRLQRAATLSGRHSAEVADTKRRELSVYRGADRIVCVTDTDADVVGAEIPGADIVVVPNAHEEVDTGPDYNERQGCLFVGNFNHPPNADAVGWWKQEIGPLVAATLPDVELTVIGNDPLGVAADLAGPRLSVTGTVASTLPFLHGARVSVAPLRYGAGMKGKVGEALMAGVPVVLTSVAAEGMGLVDEEHVLVADTADAFAAAVRRLYEDPELWRRLRHAGRDHALRSFGLDRMRRGVEEMISGLAETAPSRPRRSLAPSS